MLLCSRQGCNWGLWTATQRIQYKHSVLKYFASVSAFPQREEALGFTAPVDVKHEVALVLGRHTWSCLPPFVSLILRLGYQVCFQVNSTPGASGTAQVTDLHLLRMEELVGNFFLFKGLIESWTTWLVFWGLLKKEPQSRKLSCIILTTFDCIRVILNQKLILHCLSERRAVR